MNTPHRDAPPEESFVIPWRAFFAAVSNALSYLPLAALGAGAGAAVTVAWVHSHHPRLYQATALFEMLPPPLKSLLEPLENKTLSARAEFMEQQNILDDSRVKELYGKDYWRQKTPQAEATAQKASIATYTKIILSPQVKKMAQDKMQREGFSEFAPFAGAQAVSHTNLLEIKTLHANPVIAYKTANAWAESIVEFIERLNTEQNEIGRSFINKQYRQTKSTINEIMARIGALKEKAQINVKETAFAAKKDALLKNIEEFELVKAQIKEAEFRLPALKKIIEERTSKNQTQKFLLDQERLERINAKLLQKIEKRPEMAGSLSKQLTEIKTVAQIAHPLYVRFNEEEIETAIKLETLRPKQQLLETSIATLSQEVASLENDLNEYRMSLAALEKDLEIAHRQNQMIFGKVSEADLTAEMRYSDLRLVSYSAMPDSMLPAPTDRALKKGGATGAGLGLILGFYFPQWRKRKEAKKPTLPPARAAARETEKETILN